MQGVKEEAIELKDSTQETLVKEEIDETNSSKKRDFIIKEYRFTDNIFAFLTHLFIVDASMSASPYNSDKSLLIINNSLTNIFLDN